MGAKAGDFFFYYFPDLYFNALGLPHVINLIFQESSQEVQELHESTEVHSALESHMVHVVQDVQEDDEVYEIHDVQEIRAVQQVLEAHDVQ